MHNLSLNYMPFIWKLILIFAQNFIILLAHNMFRSKIARLSYSQKTIKECEIIKNYRLDDQSYKQENNRHYFSLVIYMWEYKICFYNSSYKIEQSYLVPWHCIWSFLIYLTSSRWFYNTFNQYTTPLFVLLSSPEILISTAFP